jgi:hypothetical protein
VNSGQSIGQEPCFTLRGPIHAPDQGFPKEYPPTMNSVPVSDENQRRSSDEKQDDGADMKMEQ